MNEESSRFWDQQAEHFDDEPDHGLRDPAVRDAWASLLREVLPPPPGTVLDLGCGTGSLSVLLSQAGYQVTGVDLSPRMVDLATTKARDCGVLVPCLVGDAADPPVEGTFDVVLTRHLAWAIEHLPDALARWADLLAPTGVLVMVEGRWSSGAGLSAADLVGQVRAVLPRVSRSVLDDPALWGGPISDKRYLLLAGLSDLG